MIMFLLWVYRKLMRWYQRQISPWMPVFKAIWMPVFKTVYIAWVALAVLLFIVDVAFFTNEGYLAKTYDIIRHTLLPIIRYTVIYPIGFYWGWKFADWLRSQRNDFSYFKDNNGKFKNEEKLKNDERKSNEDWPNEEESKTDHTPTLEDIAVRKFKEGYKNGLRNSLSQAKEKPNSRASLNNKVYRRYGALSGVDVPDGIDSYDPENLNLDTSKVIRNNRLQEAGQQSVTLDSEASSKDSFYNGFLITIDSGNGIFQHRFIIGYNGETKVATLDEPWGVIPDENSIYTLSLSQDYWRSEPAIFKDIRNSSIFIDGSGTYIRKDKPDETGEIKEDEVTQEEPSSVEDTSYMISNEESIEITPDLGQTPKNTLTSEDGEILDGVNPDDSVVTLEDLLKNQKKNS